MRFYKPNKGVTLPTLTKPAGPADIVLDKEAINVSGQKLVGKLDIDRAITVNGDVEIPLQTFDVIDGSKGLKVAGSLGNATAADIVKGKNAFTDAGFVEGALEVTGGEPAYTLQIKTQNSDPGKEYIIYYEPGSSEKTMLALTNDLQTITCGDFICLNRTDSYNTSTNIRFFDSNSAPLFIASVSTNPKYVVNATPRGWNTINIGAVKRDYPNVAQIIVSYLD